jgi:ABC-type Fe3+-hydroxamate transport system substrate-binding protein
MRVVSFVPSWTETLLEAGVEVVGRTRFCIHGPGIEGIPQVGGTKDWNLSRLESLRPDLLILDREENPRFMSEQGIPFYASHVSSIQDMPRELRALSKVLENEKLKKMALAFEDLPKCIPPHPMAGVLESAIDGAEYSEVVYLIWKDPWMAVGRETFIASVLEYCGFRMSPLDGKYPVVELSDFDPKSTLLIFSSEPYPFLKKKAGLAQLGFPYLIVDGEKFSWFGVRALRFLDSLRAKG